MLIVSNACLTPLENGNKCLRYVWALWSNGWIQVCLKHFAIEMTEIFDQFSWIHPSFVPTTKASLKKKLKEDISWLSSLFILFPVVCEDKILKSHFIEIALSIALTKKGKLLHYWIIYDLLWLFKVLFLSAW